MNILIPDSWLREFLETNASPQDIARCLSLCGPTVDRINKINNDYVYDIEITTNRVDAMSVYGIAREAAAILPQFGYKAKLNPYKTKKVKHDKPLDIKVLNNPKLCSRVLAIKLENIKLGQSPKWLQERLIKVGQRPLNNAIDISNYIMWEVGHPTHVFDYDRITEKKIVVREAKKGEILTTLDGIEYKLNGGEVVFDNGKGEIIDLPGIMGTKNTVVTNNTKNILFWIESVDAKKIRYSSMHLNIRSQAAILNEKSVDLELGLPVIQKGVELFQNICNAKVTSKLLDIYPNKRRTKTIQLNKTLIDKKLGINLSKKEISKYLTSLNFSVKWLGNILKVKAPTFRIHDIEIPEDIIEEIARIYGYYKFPSNLMSGKLPDKLVNSPFGFEYYLKTILVSLGATEVYTLSLVPKEWIEKNALRLKNPLGSDSEYLRTSLLHSLVSAIKQNSSETKAFHLFEMANVYLPKKNDLPYEKMYLAGIFANTKYRSAKGIIESLIEILNIKVVFNQVDEKGFKPAQRVELLVSKEKIGQLGILNQGYVYYEFEVSALHKYYQQYPTYKPIPKFPAQIEDITLILPQRTLAGEVMQTIKSIHKNISEIQLKDVFKNSYTFRIWYQDPKKTLEDKEVESIREILLREVKRIYEAIPKV